MKNPTAFWDNIAERYAREPIKDMASYEHTLERTASYLRPGMQVLEIGCGTGSTALRLASTGARITATDLSPEMIRIARAKPAPDPAPRFEVATAEALPEGPWEAVLAFNLLHLVRDVPAVLRRIRAQMAPGAVFVSKSAALGSGPLWIRAVIPPMQWIGKAPFVNVFTTQALDAMVREAGFEILETGDFPKKPPAHFIAARAI